MIFASSAVLFFAQTWFLPWWTLCLVSLALGFFTCQEPKATRSVALGAGVAWILRAAWWNEQSSGSFSKRLAGLLSLPEVWLIYVVIGLLAFITAGLWARSGLLLRSQVQSPTLAN